MEKTVHIVHCIDTEGPLYESVEATFERLRNIFNLDLEPSVELLRRLQKGEVDLGGMENAVRKVVDPHLLAYNDTWDKVEQIFEERLARVLGRLSVPRRGDLLELTQRVDALQEQIYSIHRIQENRTPETGSAQS